MVKQIYRVLNRSVLTIGFVAFSTLPGCSIAIQSSATTTVDEIHEEIEGLEYGQIPTKVLIPVSEVWKILKSDFVEPDKIVIADVNTAVIQALTTAIGIEIDASIGGTQELPAEFPDELLPIWNAWAATFLRHNTASHQLNPINLEQTIIRAILTTLDDPYTTYVPPGRFKIDSRDLRGDYEGIGAEIHKTRNQVTLNPMPEGPAEIAGIKVGDILLEINGTPVGGLTVIEIVNAVRGPKGSTVTIQIQPVDGTPIRNVPIVRAIINIKSVTWNVIADEFVYVKLHGFYDNTFDSITKIMTESLDPTIHGMVLDLRNNPGGLLTSVVDIASIFLEPTQVVTLQKDRTGNQVDWLAKELDSTWDHSLVVIVNEYSASASEVLSGALQDHGRAQLVGVQTFGKGSVNRLKGLSDGGGLYYTYSRWYTPNGHLIEGEGLKPDFPVLANINQSKDRQLEQALLILRQTSDSMRVDEMNISEGRYAEEHSVAIKTT